jgi:DNA-binding MarR family transcriptional regulator
MRLSSREPEPCNCLALRQAARRATQLYDRALASTGLRTTQFSILFKLSHHGPMTIQALADDLVLDRTTLGRTMLPLQRDGLIAIRAGASDRRSKELRLTRAGAARLGRAVACWRAAQAGFERAFGRARAAELRAILRDVAAIGAEPADDPAQGGTP